MDDNTLGIIIIAVLILGCFVLLITEKFFTSGGDKE